MFVVLSMNNVNSFKIQMNSINPTGYFYVYAIFLVFKKTEQLPKKIDSNLKIHYLKNAKII